MTTQQPPTVADLLTGGGNPAAKFPNVGDSITGTIVGTPRVRQSTDLDGKPQTWDDGNPKWEIVCDLKTDAGEARTLYVRGRIHTALREACKQAGVQGISEGGRLTVTYTGDGEQTRAGFNPPKLYSATYAPPNVNVAEQPQQPVATSTTEAVQQGNLTAAQVEALAANGLAPRF